MNEKAGIKLSTKTWHYKLIKFVLRSGAPTPQNMHNLCPYFWLLIFSMFVSPFVLLGSLIDKLRGLMVNGFVNFIEYVLIEPTAASWFRRLNDMDAYLLLKHDRNIPNLYTKSKLGKTDSGYPKKTSELLREWFKTTYNKEMFILSKSGNPTHTHSEDFTVWKVKQQSIAYIESRRLEDLAEKRRSNRKINPKQIGVNIQQSCSNVMNYVQSWNTIIKWTKRFFGGLSTFAGLTGVYYAVNLIGRGFLWLIENFNGPVVLENLIMLGLMLLSAVGIIGLFVLIRLWVLYVAEQGLKLWYSKMIYYPIYWLIFLPMKFLFIDLIFTFILVNLVKGVIGGAKTIWFGILGFTGIFGEYFGASYTDYCPGIEWEENKEE